MPGGSPKKGRNIPFLLIPSPFDIEENEIADELAKTILKSKDIKN